MVDFQRIIVLTVSFLIVAIVGIFFEKLFNLVKIDQKRPTSFFVRQEGKPNLRKFLKRYGAISLRYLEIFFLAGIGLLFEWLIRTGLTKTFKFLIPILILYIPISYLIVTLCVPKDSFWFFFPKWYEWIIVILLMLIGVGILVFMLQ